MMQLKLVHSFLLVLLICFLLLIHAKSKHTKKSSSTTSSSTSIRNTSPIYELVAKNVSHNLEDWQVDQAIMFYAPWCKHCKELQPYWQSMANIFTKSHPNDLTMAKFNCESNTEHRKLCQDLEVTHYPTSLFIGYGNFHQNAKKGFWVKKKYPQLVHYVADLYPEAIYQWILMLSSMSKIHRRWDEWKSLLTGKTTKRTTGHHGTAMNEYDDMKKRMIEAEEKAELFGRELERYKANELFDSLDDMGDVFPLLHSLKPDEQNLPLRLCVGDMAGEYCKYYQDDSYCRLLDRCVAQSMEPEACRPKTCPFDDPRGCKVVSTCMRTDVIEEYKKAVAASL